MCEICERKRTLVYKKINKVFLSLEKDVKEFKRWQKEMINLNAEEFFSHYV